MSPKPGLILQHGENGPLARFGEWLRERGLPFVVAHIWEEPVPDARKFAFVVSLGSIHSAASTEPAWIQHEIAALRTAAEHDVPALGLCFGGQALSVALEGGTDPLPAPEIGWIPIESFDRSVPGGPWLQYHSEQMRVPPGARELARSPAGPAVFTRGPHMGVQFHPEADAGLANLWAQKDPDLPDAGLTPADIASQSAAHAQPAREQAFRLFDAWIDGAVKPA
ncbi:MAG: type 1 glutamine amidotransferase [Solirubrobacterales bacterium]|nr:type 1 glutamine amidotransferase [Solirubrobacterales bacterium]